jgi:hypothetical protein
LFSVNPNYIEEIKSLLKENNLEPFTIPIGKMISKTDKAVKIEK